jgi:hypothetical protein
MNSPKLYEIILDYYMSMEEADRNLNNLDRRHATTMIHSFFFVHPSIDSPEFLKIVKCYILENLTHFNKL